MTNEEFKEIFHECFDIHDLVEKLGERKLHFFFNSEINTPIHWSEFPVDIIKIDPPADWARVVDLRTGMARDISMIF